MAKSPFLPIIVLAVCCILSVTSAAQQQTLGSIIGHIQIVRGDAPPERILVSLEVRGAPMNSVYTDSSGAFGFHSLAANPYTVVINDDHYEPVRRSLPNGPKFSEELGVSFARNLALRKERLESSSSAASRNGMPDRLFRILLGVTQTRLLLCR